MNRKPLLITIACLWVGTLFAAYMVGKSSYSKGDPEAGSGGSGSRSGQDGRLSSIESEVVGGERRISAGGGGSDVASNNPQAISLLRRSLKNTNPVERMHQFMDALSMMDGADFEAAMKELEDDLKNGDNQRELGLLLYAWAEKDGAAALGHLETIELGRQGWNLYQSALSAWGGSDPEAAIDWAEEKHASKKQGGQENNENYYMVGVINGLVKTNPERAGQIAQEIGFGRARGQALGTVVDALFKQSSVAAQLWVENMGNEDSRFRAGAAGRIASQMAREDPAAAGEWVLGLGLEETERAISSVTYEWGRKAPEEAAAWTANIEDPETRSRGMASVVESWARRDANAAGTWLGKQPPSPELDRPVRSFAYTVQERDPQSAITWANTITSGEMRSEVVSEVGARWLRRNPTEAKAYLQTQENLPESLQRRLID